MLPRYLLFIIAIVAILLSGCTPAPSPSPTIAPSLPPPPSPEGYPAGVVPTVFDYTAEQGYPAPEQDSIPTAVQLPESLEIPEPSESTGNIIGQLLTPGPGGQPYFGMLYLARTINADKEGYPPIIAFSDSTDPVATQDKAGRFLFTNIVPGTYALVIWNPVTSTVIEDPDTNDYFLFDVTAGTTTDLGIVPIP